MFGHQIASAEPCAVLVASLLLPTMPNGPPKRSTAPRGPNRMFLSTQSHPNTSGSSDESENLSSDSDSNIRPLEFDSELKQDPEEIGRRPKIWLWRPFDSVHFPQFANSSGVQITMLVSTAWVPQDRLLSLQSNGIVHTVEFKQGTWTLLGLSGRNERRIFTLIKRQPQQQIRLGLPQSFRNEKFKAAEVPRRADITADD
ncbi:hypothetical protein DFH08DRAFT_932142 [Mycena albidolilacea]|uniref:Uncharacterized protein n=1 Tax=Mycena albidolilacea TaxID=1033008 RepID=A0AAD7EYW1_9AGAR|nr:hypothetical protein DFH08DRAFT_932142 [Mycena albidolilacea]